MNTNKEVKVFLTEYRGETGFFSTEYAVCLHRGESPAIGEGTACWFSSGKIIFSENIDILLESMGVDRDDVDVITLGKCEICDKEEASKPEPSRR